PLGDWSRERAADLADQLDCVIVGGGDVLSRRAVADSQPRDDRATPGRGSLSSLLISGLGPQLERGCPVMWLAANLPIEPTPEEAATLRSTMARMPYHSVRDENSKHRLKAAGVDQGVTVVPDPTLLVARHFDPEALGKRLEYLRLMGWYPSRGRALVLQGDGDLMSFVPALGRHVARLFQAQDD